MFDFSWSEIVLTGTIAVLVLGPKELPQAMRTLAKFMRQARRLANEFQGHVNDIMREAELDELRQSVQKLGSANVTAAVNNLVDPTGEMRSELASVTSPPPAVAAGFPTAPPETPPAENNAPDTAAADTVTQDAPAGAMAAAAPPATEPLPAPHPPATEPLMPPPAPEPIGAPSSPSIPPAVEPAPLAPAPQKSETEQPTPH